MLNKNKRFVQECLIQITHNDTLKQPTPCSRVLTYKNWTAGLSSSVDLYVLITLTSCYFDWDDSRQPHNIIERSISLCQHLLYCLCSCVEGVGGGGSKIPWLFFVPCISQARKKKRRLCFLARFPLKFLKWTDFQIVLKKEKKKSKYFHSLETL